MCSPSAMVRQIEGIFCDRALPAEDRPRRTRHAQSALVTPLGVNSRAVAVAAANNMPSHLRARSTRCLRRCKDKARAWLAHLPSPSSQVKRKSFSRVANGLPDGSTRWRVRFGDVLRFCHGVHCLLHRQHLKRRTMPGAADSLRPARRFRRLCLRQGQRNVALLAVAVH